MIVVATRTRPRFQRMKSPTGCTQRPHYYAAWAAWIERVGSQEFTLAYAFLQMRRGFLIGAAEHASDYPLEHFIRWNGATIQKPRTGRAT